MSYLDPEMVNDVKAEIHERFPDANWPNTYRDTVWHGSGEFDDLNAVEDFDVIVHERQEPMRMMMENGRYETRIADRKRCVAVSDEYQFIPHELALKNFLSAVEGQNSIFGKPGIGINLYDVGGKMEVSLRYPEAKKDLKVDEALPVFGLRNGTDLQWQYSLWGGAEVLRCTNGMVSTNVALSFKKKHRQNLEQSELLEDFSNGMAALEDQFLIWSGWVDKLITQTQTVELLERLPVSEKQGEKLLALPEVGTGRTLVERFDAGEKVNLWNVNSIVTQWMTHDVNLSSGRREREEKTALVMEQFARTLGSRN